MKIQKWMRRLFMSLLLGFACLCVIFPVYYMFNTSLLSEADLLSFPPKLIPINLTLRGYKQVLAAGDVQRWILNSSIVALGATILNLVLASLGGYALSRYPFKINRWIGILLYITQMLPPVLLVTPIFIIFASLGLVNNLLGLILVDTGITLAVSTWILKSFFDGIPKEIEAAALADGCSRFTVFTKIALPLCRPALISVGAITFFDVWNEYVFGLTLILDKSKWVGTVGIASYTGQIATLWDQMMAGTSLFCLVPLVLFLLLNRYIASGLTEGALK